MAIDFSANLLRKDLNLTEGSRSQASMRLAWRVGTVTRVLKAVDTSIIQRCMPHTISSDTSRSPMTSSMPGDQLPTTAAASRPWPFGR